MKRTTGLLLRSAVAFAVLAVAFSSGCGTAPRSAPARLTVVHVNDSHQHMFPFSTIEQPKVRGGFARLATVVAQARRGSSPVLLLHGGDSLVGSASTYFLNGLPDYKRLPTYGYRGLESVEIMNMMGFDAMAVGNHELDYGKRWFEKIMGRAKFAILSANVFKRELPDIDGAAGKPLAKPYVILRKGGLRIGIIGLTTVDYMQSVQVKVGNPFDAARELVPEVEKQCDLVVVLSHVGFKPDLELARIVSGIDLIVGAHTHTLVPEPVLVGETLVVQAGAYLEQVGILDLTVEGGKITSYQYQMKPLDESVPLDPAVDAALRHYLSIGSVGDQRLQAVMFQRNGIGSLATSAMLAATSADAALVPADAFRGEIGPGAPTVRQFFDVFWPYHPRSQIPEKDLTERQLLSTLIKPPELALRTVMRASDGLRTLVLVKVPSQAFAAWLTVNEGLQGDPDYVQVDLRDPSVASAAGGQLRTLVMPINLVLGLKRLGLEVDPQQVQTTDTELFEAVLGYLNKSTAK